MRDSTGVRSEHIGESGYFYTTTRGRCIHSLQVNVTAAVLDIY